MSELDEIRLSWEAGRLEPIRGDLELFLQAHKGRIGAFRDDQARAGQVLDPETAVKLYILRHRSVNPKRDIEEQAEEIRRETWIRGIQLGCAPEPAQVAQEWAERHSAAWRAHRVTTIVFVFEQEKDRYLGLLRC